MHIDWRLALAVTAAAVVGALVGARLTAMVDPDALRKAFGWFVLAMSSVILAQEIDPSIGAIAGGRDSDRRGNDVRVQPIRALPPAPPHPLAASAGDGLSPITSGIYPRGYMLL